VAPYGVYDIAANTGWINLGITSDTATFAVESIRCRWCPKSAFRRRERPVATSEREPGEAVVWVMPGRQ
jgi:hypothetical protein